MVQAVTNLAGKLFGSRGEAATDLFARLSQHGFSADQLQAFLPKVLEFFKDKLPPEALDKVEGLMPGLSRGGRNRAAHEPRRRGRCGRGGTGGLPRGAHIKMTGRFAATVSNRRGGLMWFAQARRAALRVLGTSPSAPADAAIKGVPARRV